MRQLIPILLMAAAASGQSTILKSMQAELSRAQASLAKQDPPPYFFGYTVTDVDALQLSASNGSLESTNQNRARWLDVSVRVGNYDLDNTHQVPGESSLPPFQLPRRGPFDDGDAVLRRALWRATDRAYRDAARQYLRVKTAKDVRVAAEDNSPDFARTDPAQHEGSPATLGSGLDDRIAVWKTQLRTWSEAFRRETHILNSHVTLTARAATRYVVTSDGLAVASSTVLYRLGLLAESKADDGMDLNRFESFAWSTPGGPGEPTSDAVVAKIAAMSADLKALRQAPVLEPYSGPAILSGRAAAVFFHEALGHRVEGHRQRQRNDGQTFTRKVGERILPAFLNVRDDPTQPEAQGTPLMGHYRHDDEGIAAERVSVVEDGVLRNFLLSRTPVRGFVRSNGHGRGEPGQTPVGRQGSLMVSSTRAVSRERLRRLLIDEVRRRKKPYGLLFGDVEGGYTQTHRFQAQVFQVFPLMVWRIFPDGRPDELVRGAELVGTPLVTLGKISAAGDDPQVFNGYCGAESGFIPVSAVAPSLLISEMEVQKKAKSGDRPPILAPPSPIPHPPSPAADPVMEAMSDELSRSSKELRLGDMERPYYVEYRLADIRRMEISAAMGALTESSDMVYRPATVGVRVGDPALDNSNFVSTSEAGSGNGAAESFTVAADSRYESLRQDLWLGTDQAYKRALSSLAAKRALLKTSEREDALADFGASAARTVLAPRRDTPGAAGCQEMAKRLSGRLASHAGLLDSTLRFSLTNANQYFANSEGSRLRRPDLVWTWRASATTAADGIRLRAGFTFTGVAAAPCTREEERVLETRVDGAARDLLAAASAPRGEEYIGPVLVEASPAAEIFAALLPAAITGRRAPLSDSVMMGDSSDRDGPTLNSRILPAAFEVVDTPNYDVDDEGVPAQTVKVIEKGLLKRLLTSRTPVRGGLESNGHARATPGGAAMVAPSRMSVQSGSAISVAEMKDRLRALCRERGQEYGLLLRRFQAVTSAEELSPDDLADPGPEGLLSSLGGMRSGSPLQPLAVWKVYAADGREELVRGLRLTDLRLSALKTILAAGTESATYSGFYAPAPQFSFGITALGGPTDGVPFSVTAPAVLFDELELRPQRRSSDRGPAYPPPAK